MWTTLSSSAGHHHWKVHEEGWRLIRTDAGVVALPPPSGVDTG